MAIMANSRALPLVQYLVQLNLSPPFTSDSLNVSALLSADVYRDELAIITANYGFDGYMGVPGLRGVDDAARQIAYDHGVSWQELDPALDAPARAYYSAVGDAAFLAAYGVSVVQGDTIPVVFSHPVLASSIRPESFEIQLNTGEWVTPLTASLLPNGEYNERQTVVLTGYWGNRLESDHPDALHPVLVRIAESETPLTFVTPQGLVSAAGLEIASANPYDAGNGPRLVAANLDQFSTLGEGAPFWLIASNGNSGADLFGDEAQFRLRLYTSAGFSPDGIRSILPTEFGRFFRLEARDALGEPVWIDEAGVDYTISGHGSVRVLGIADTGPAQAQYDDAYVEDHDNQYDIILAGDRAAVEQLVRVHMPSGGDYDAVYNPGGPGNDPASNPDTPFTVPSSPQAIEVSNLMGDDPYVSFVELGNAVYRDPASGQPLGANLGIALYDTATGHTVYQYRDPAGQLFYASFQVSSDFSQFGSANHPVLFEAANYLGQNPDVFAAMGIDHAQAWQHYLAYGASESLSPGGASRAPASWFDIDFYLHANPDVARAADSGAFAFHHFMQYGMAEFRAPNALGTLEPLSEHSLLQYAQANVDLMQAFGIDSDATQLTATQQYELALHFHRWGYLEGREAEPTMLTLPDPLIDLSGVTGAPDIVQFV